MRKQPCETCGQPHWFRYWVDTNCAASREGLSVADFDLVFHRFKRKSDVLGDRDLEHLMFVEVKIQNENLGLAQADTLSVVAGHLEMMIQTDGTPIGVKSRPHYHIPGEKKVVHHGVHLLRVPATRSEDGPFVWDGKRIDGQTLRNILNFEIDPVRMSRRVMIDIERRHKAAKTPAPMLPGFSEDK